MGKIIRLEFMGSWLIFFILCISGFGIPLAILYLITGTVTVVEEMENPSEFILAYRNQKR